MNDEAVYRTAPGTPGLFMNVCVCRYLPWLLLHDFMGWDEDLYFGWSKIWT